jgi:hypothetical protein
MSFSKGVGLSISERTGALEERAGQHGEPAPTLEPVHYGVRLKLASLVSMPCEAMLLKSFNFAYAATPDLPLRKAEVSWVQTNR